jgi:four helix bundle protein
MQEDTMPKKLKAHRDLDVYQLGFDAAMQIFEATKRFPKEETYSLTDQVRRSSRAVCSNIAEAWRRRRHEGAFENCLNIAEAEAAETQVWLEFAVKCGYLDVATARKLYVAYDQILGKLVMMIRYSEKWIIG